MANFLHQADLPDDVDLGPVIAIDTETMGLNLTRDRLCLVQVSDGKGDAHLVQMPQRDSAGTAPFAGSAASASASASALAPNLCRQLGDPTRLKLMHFARFDIASVFAYLGVLMTNVYCTKLASRMIRTTTDRHGLRDLCKEMLGVEISKFNQTSDWGAPTLSPEQLDYAASDVLHLHALKEHLDALLVREGRAELAQQCFDFLPYRAQLDLLGWDCLLYTSPSPRDKRQSRMPSSA